MRLMGHDLRKTGLAVRIGEIEGAKDGDAHPLLALKIGAVVGHMALEDEHGARARLDRIPAADIGGWVVARPKPLSDIDRIVKAHCPSTRECWMVHPPDGSVLTEFLDLAARLVPQPSPGSTICRGPIGPVQILVNLVQKPLDTIQKKPLSGSGKIRWRHSGGNLAAQNQPARAPFRAPLHHANLY